MGTEYGKQVAELTKSSPSDFEFSMIGSWMRRGAALDLESVDGRGRSFWTDVRVESFSLETSSLASFLDRVSFGLAIHPRETTIIQKWP